MKRQLIALIVLFSFLLASCATMVRIETNVPGATVKINNQKVGKTPLQKSLSDFAFQEYDVTIEKEGYEILNTQLAKEAKVGPIVGGIFFIFPFLWCYGPSPYQYFDLTTK